MQTIRTTNVTPSNDGRVRIPLAAMGTRPARGDLVTLTGENSATLAAVVEIDDVYGLVWLLPLTVVEPAAIRLS